MNKVRVRYAPSPTGYLHIGGARSALFNYLYARKNNGDFVFRIEDTDIERNIEGAIESQLHDLEWLGIIPDESLEKPNPKYAPYTQMEKLDVYKKYADMLIEKGLAYECFCSSEDLEKSREEQLQNGVHAPMYDGKCLNLSDEEKDILRKKGIKPVIRVKIPKDKIVEFNDLVRGKVSFNSNDIGDWVILKSNGIPTYNFAVVVDDHLMEISHVLRGEEHLSNTPKQILLYDYFGWETPLFGHMTIIINESGKKLSKRDLNIIQFISQYKEQGYLPEAIFNFLLLLGWSPSGENEFFSKESAIQEFDISRLSSSPSTFDVKKMMWMNQHYIRLLNDNDYYDYSLPYVKEILKGKSKEEIISIINIFKDEIFCLSQLKELIEKQLVEIPLQEEHKIFINESKEVISLFAKYLNECEVIDSINIKAIFKRIQTETGIKGRNLFMPIRLSLTSHEHGPEIYNLILILGKEESLRRLNK